ncbi:hypothetical protein [Teredinibacter turnerae]|uniref:hypothetical protein n=1 Tax=Teredinibacter turnerae TaxID=2426 RepID=UPI000373258C|nr:hypothetical protein [Teredinibacter turnerae]
MWGLVLNLVGGTFKDWVKSRSDLAEKKAVARIENVSKGIPGYSDEYLILVWSYPCVASFVPSLQPSVTAGFAFMDSMPEWYVAGFVTISFAVFGIDKLFKIRGK